MFSNISDDFVWNNLKNIEVNSLCERSALSNYDDVTFFYWKGRGTMDWNISMSFLISIIFGNIVEVVSSHNNSPLHLCWYDNSFQDLASNRDVAGEWAFLVNIFGFDGLFRSFETKSNILEIPDSRWSLLCEKLFAVEEHSFLFLEWSFVLR